MSSASQPAKPVKHTYSSNSSRQRQLPSSSSVLSSDTVVPTSSSPPQPLGRSSKRKRVDDESNEKSPLPSLYASSLFPFGKKRKTLVTGLLPAKGKPKPKKENLGPSPTSKLTPKPTKPLTQLHLSFATSIRTCERCSLSYTRGAPDDEHLHKTHCARVSRGMEWGKEEDKSSDVRVIEAGVRLRNGRRGRVIAFSANAKGKLHAKAEMLMETINFALSSPPLPPSTLSESKFYLFLMAPESSASQQREKIAGCVIASRIKTAMRIVPSSEYKDGAPRSDLVWVDGDDGGIFCDPAPLPTTMGIPRLFVPSEYRHKGVASVLLSAAARTFIYGCPLDPTKGEVAFSQPTGDGRAVMLHWGKGGVRIFQE